MFRNGSEMDGGDTAYLGPTTIIEMTIPRSQSSSAATLDDSGVLAGPVTMHCIGIILVYIYILRNSLIKHVFVYILPQLAYVVDCNRLSVTIM